MNFNECENIEICYFVCKVISYFLDSFYRIKDFCENGGERALQEVSRKSLILKVGLNLTLKKLLCSL